MLKLVGKIAIITGASTGIGRTTAKLFAKEGAKVAIADIRDKEGSETVDEIIKAGGEATYISTNMMHVDEIEKTIHKVVAMWGQLNIYHHNAGMAGLPIGMMTEADWDRCIGVNLKAAVFGAKYAIPEFRKVGGGVLLFTSSSNGLKPMGGPDYNVAKAGVVMLVRALTAMHAREGIRVNSICPGSVPGTAMQIQFNSFNKEVLIPSRWEKMKIEGMKNTSLAMPMGRLGTEEDMAKAALFLVSDDASYITGVNLAVDGGYSAV